MEIGVTSEKYRSIPLPLVLGLQKWMGVTFAEMTMHFLNRPPLMIPLTRKMQLGLHLPNLGNSGYDFSDSTSLKIIEKDIFKICKYIHRFSIQYAVCHPPEADPSHKGLETLCDHLIKVDIPLVLENIRPLSFEQFFLIYKEMKSVLRDRLWGVCLDIPHAYLIGDDWQRYFKEFGEDIRVIHLSNCSKIDDTHLAFGSQGVLNHLGILENIKSFGFDGFLNYEIMPISLTNLHDYFQTIHDSKTFFGFDIPQKIESRSHYIPLVSRFLKCFFSS